MLVRFGGGPGGCDWRRAAAGIGPGGDGGGSHFPVGGVVGAFGCVGAVIGGVIGWGGDALASPLQPPGRGAAAEPGAVKLISTLSGVAHTPYIGDAAGAALAAEPHAAFIGDCAVAALVAASLVVGPAHTSNIGDCRAMESNWEG